MWASMKFLPKLGICVSVDRQESSAKRVLCVGIFLQ